MLLDMVDLSVSKTVGRSSPGPWAEGPGVAVPEGSREPIMHRTLKSLRFLAPEWVMEAAANEQSRLWRRVQAGAPQGQIVEFHAAIGGRD